MRRKIAIGTLGLTVLLAVAIISWGQDGPPQGGGPGQGQHQMGGGGQHNWGGGQRQMGGGEHKWGDGQRRFADGGRGQFGMNRRMGGPGGRRMGMRRGGGRGFGGGGGMMRMAENPRVRQALGLTDDQVARLRTISVNAEKTSVETRAKMQVNRIELRELMRGDNPDQSAIMAKMDEINTLQGTMQKQHVQAMFSARSVLTPDQQKKLKTLMENRGTGGEGRGNMMERRGGPGRSMGHPGGAPGATPKPQTPPAQ